MTLVKYFYITLLSIAFVSCGNNPSSKIDFTINTNAVNNKILNDKPLNLSINNPKNLIIDSVSYFINNNPSK